MGSLKPWNNFDWKHFVELNKMAKTFKVRHLPVSNHESWKHCKVVTVPTEWKNPVKSKSKPKKKKSTPSPKPITVFDSSDEEAEASAGSASAPVDPSDEESEEASAGSAAAPVDPSATEEENSDEKAGESSDNGGDDNDGPASPSSIKRTRSRKTPSAGNSLPARRKKRKMTARKSQNDSPKKVRKSR